MRDFFSVRLLHASYSSPVFSSGVEQPIMFKKNSGVNSEQGMFLAVLFLEENPGE
jgi:hypothetical protein